MITDPMGVFVVLLAVLAALFTLQSHPATSKLFKVVPLLVFAYFVPTLLSNIGIIPLESPAYSFIKKWLLPSALVLLTLSIDVPAILKLGKNSLILFFVGSLSVLIGGPVAFFIAGRWLPPEFLDQAWRGLAALCGSWIGGGANFVAIGESVGAHSTTISMMVIVDVVMSSLWMAVLFFFAGREKEMDEKMGADRTAIEELKVKVEQFYLEVSRVPTLRDLLLICAIAFVSTGVSIWLSKILPPIGDIVSGFTWVVILVTTVGVALSFTPLRKLEGAGASKIGSVFLYLLIATIGAGAEFKKVFDVPVLILIGGIWILIHVAIMMITRRVLRAPIFFLAVGSQANIGAAASAPVVAGAFHPTLAPVGVLLAVLGYALGTYGGVLCAFILEVIARFLA